MYEIYCKLRDAKGVKDADVARDTGITKSTFSDWKSGRSIPKQEKLQKIADYFNVPTSCFTGEKEFDAYSDDNAHMVSRIRSDIELSKVLPKYFELPENKKKHIIELINLLSE